MLRRLDQHLCGAGHSPTARLHMLVAAVGGGRRRLPLYPAARCMCLPGKPAVQPASIDVFKRGGGDATLPPHLPPSLRARRPDGGGAGRAADHPPPDVHWRSGGSGGGGGPRKSSPHPSPSPSLPLPTSSPSLPAPGVGVLNHRIGRAGDEQWPVSQGGGRGGHDGRPPCLRAGWGWLHQERRCTRRGPPLWPRRGARGCAMGGPRRPRGAF